MSNCVANPDDATLDFSDFEDEEAQIQAVFREAIRLKRRVKGLTAALSDVEEARSQEIDHLRNVLEEKENMYEQALADSSNDLVQGT